MRSSIAAIALSISISGCTLMSVAPGPADCPRSAPAARAKLAPVHFAPCPGYAACLTKAELAQLASEIAELKKEAGR